ncbi:TetR/AcrR family transcriptional regulator [Sphingosinicella rhizophila]|uniref:TetR/AcrR family transcriptional regulator n=1 Tax=Sphingosinicella rhizophila TaxID=3050082 RepID=A0ABU3Q3H0_9SPHN|nr:TetR/AcrR family transcriptional regulator [Sphingosinicella sp. GR2756]MDT9597956.1 TetR/AcrR family transcriptional regulator [Sphingosinicella sp. GR2756]
MAKDLNSVNITSSPRSYHHGALRQALIEAAEAVITERGVDGFSLRETARRAGVSPAAPGHHFKDARGLLTAVATQAFQAFGDALSAADMGGDRKARIRAQGMAYVRFALAHPAKFDLLWRKALIDDADPDYAAAGKRAFLILDKAVRGDRPSAGDLDPSMAPSIAAWSIVHGFARLAMDGLFGTGPGAAERAAEALLPHILDHLDV